MRRGSAGPAQEGKQEEASGPGKLGHQARPGQARPAGKEWPADQIEEEKGREKYFLYLFPNQFFK